MLLDAVVLLIVGITAALMPFSPTYRSYLTRRLARQAGAEVPHTQVADLEARMARRAWGAGGGIVLTGLLLLTWALVRPAGADYSSDGAFLVLSVMFIAGAAGLTVVEILRPGHMVGGPRTARASAPVLADYLPPLVRILAAVVPVLALLLLLGALGLSWSPWFDAGTLRRSPLPLLLVAIPVLALLSALAARAVLAAPQPARDETDLFWQDIVRAGTLSTQTLPPALVGMWGLFVAGSVLDDAASAAAAAQGQVGPAWSLGLLIAGYVVPLLIMGVALAATIRWPGNELRHTKDRLWGGRSQEATSGAGGGG